MQEKVKKAHSTKSKKKKKNTNNQQRNVVTGGRARDAFTLSHVGIGGQP